MNARSFVARGCRLAIGVLLFAAATQTCRAQGHAQPAYHPYVPVNFWLQLQQQQMLQRQVLYQAVAQQQMQQYLYYQHMYHHHHHHHAYQRQLALQALANQAALGNQVTQTNILYRSSGIGTLVPVAVDNVSLTLYPR